ncbi:MAG TPA: DUF4388 domain-containing protein [Kineosporiaceae bacterium]|nr:DUF4388 domain-containing protein [Kineosporiaceae bacterium]
MPDLWPPRSRSVGAVPGSRVAGEPARAGALAERLTRLGDSGRSGSLHVSGRRGAEIVFVDGRIVVAEAPTAPSAEVLLLHAVEGNEYGWETLARNGIQQARNYARAEAARLAAAGSIPPLRLEALVQSATIDAVSELFRDDGEQPGWRFRSGQRHWLGEVRPLEVSAVVAEVARRRAILQQIRGLVAPESVLTRASRLPLQRLSLSAGQWDLIRSTDGASSVGSLAWVLGRALFSTTLEAYALIRLGVLMATDSDARTIGPVPTEAGENPAPANPPTTAARRRPELSFRAGLREASTALVADTTQSDQPGQPGQPGQVDPLHTEGSR